MKFKDMPYERPDLVTYEKTQNCLLDKIQKETDLTTLKNLIETFKENKSNLDTLFSLCEVRHTINTNDTFYNEEFNFLTENSPITQKIENSFNEILLKHNKRPLLEKEYGSYYFKKLELNYKCFNDKIANLLVLEQKLSDRYDTLIAGAKISFEGKTYNLSQMAKFGQNLDRETRKKAAVAVDNFMASIDDEIGEIYLNLIQVRTKIAHELGLKGGVELGYLRLERLDYDKDKVKNFRQGIVKNIVPIASDIFKKHAKRIGIKDPKMYDFSLSFKDGNPTPKFDTDVLVQKALEMYSEMSEETKEFFNVMLKDELMDLETRPGKMSGGYCTAFPKYKVPFIFANFNKTSDDVNTLTHEAGHAFMYYYASKKIDDPDLIFPTMEAAEIHSTSMEFFAYPYLNKFFLEDTKKYIVSHIEDELTFLPYACCVDHFQHIAYENPSYTITDLKKAWQDLEKIYLPWRDYGECSFTASGTFWYKQGHIFSSPFYYIDYALAGLCALSFFLADINDHFEAWERYKKLCALGGTKPFLSLLKEVNLPDPFSLDTISDITKQLLPILEKIEVGS